MESSTFSYLCQVLSRRRYEILSPRSGSIKQLASQLKYSGSWLASLEGSLQYPLAWCTDNGTYCREVLWLHWHVQYVCVSGAMAACDGPYYEGVGPMDVCVLHKVVSITVTQLDTKVCQTRHIMSGSPKKTWLLVSMPSFVLTPISTHVFLNRNKALCRRI